MKKFFDHDEFCSTIFFIKEIFAILIHAAMVANVIRLEALIDAHVRHHLRARHVNNKINAHHRRTLKIKFFFTFTFFISN